MVNYDATSPPIVVFPSYLSFFNNLNTIDCPVDNCLLLETDCITPRIQSDVTI